VPVDVKTAARFLGVSPSLVYAYVERKQIPHSRMMGRAIRFSLSELEKWRRQFIVNGGINEYYRRTSQDLRDRFCPQEIRIWVGRVPGP
jgi:excisionase family DNA binding protein